MNTKDFTAVSIIERGCRGEALAAAVKIILTFFQVPQIFFGPQTGKASCDPALTNFIFQVTAKL